MERQEMQNYVIGIGIAILQSLTNRRDHHEGFSLRFETDSIIAIKGPSRSEIFLEGLTNLKIPSDMKLNCRIRAMKNGELWIDFENVDVEADDEDEN